jgi:hypothetical protein
MKSFYPGMEAVIDLTTSLELIELECPLNKIMTLVAKVLDINNTDELIENLRSLRTNAIECENIEEYHRIFVECWGMLESFLPPMFPSPTTDALKFLISPVFTMKQYFSKKELHPIGSGGCRVFAGPKGIGKTTMLSAFCTLCNLLTDHCEAIYWSYSGGSTDILITPLQLISFRLNVNINNCLTNLNDKKKMVVFLGDEVQDLYKEEETSLSPKEIKDRSERKKEIVKQMAVIGKSSMNVAFISGSSVNTVSFCLHP